MVPRLSLRVQDPAAYAVLRPGPQLDFAPQAALRSDKRTEHETKAARPLVGGAPQIGPAGHRLTRVSAVVPAATATAHSCGR